MRSLMTALAFLSLAACSCASSPFRRLSPELMPRIWVGPPTTSRPTPATSAAVALLTGSTVTCAAGSVSKIPAATASATAWVLPNMLS